MLLAMIFIVVASSLLIGYSISNNPPSSVLNGHTVAGGFVFFEANNLFKLLIPLLGIFEGFVLYGRDRLDGVLDSIILKPITKSAIMTVRFTACVISFFLAVGFSVLIVDYFLLGHHFSVLSQSWVAAILLTYVIEGSAFVGITFLLSHLLKSTASLLGMAFTLFFLLAVLWGDIASAVIMAFGHAYFGSFAFLRDYVIFSYASPVNYQENVAFFMTKTTPIITGYAYGPIILDPQKFGVSFLLLTLVGIAWSAIPFLICQLLTWKRD